MLVSILVFNGKTPLVLSTYPGKIKHAHKSWSPGFVMCYYIYMFYPIKKKICDKS